MAAIVQASNPRLWLEAQLKPVLPKTWKLIPYEREMDSLSAVTVMFSMKSISRFPQAPKTHRLVEYVLKVIEPRIDPDKVNDLLDKELADLLDAIDEIQNLTWETAERGLANDRANHAFEITLTFPYQKD